MSAVLTIPINQDVTKYKPKFVFGLTLRTLACIVAALGSSVAIAAVLYFVLHVPADAAMTLFWVPAIPCALVGFVTPHGMPFEKWFPLWLRQRTAEHVVLFSSPAADRSKPHAAPARLGRANKKYLKLASRKGAELWSPGGELTI